MYRFVWFFLFLFFTQNIFAQSDSIISSDTVKIFFKDKEITIITHKKRHEINNSIQAIRESLQDFKERKKQELVLLNKLFEQLKFYDSLLGLDFDTSFLALNTSKSFRFDTTIYLKTDSNLQTEDSSLFFKIDSIKFLILKTKKKIEALDNGIDDMERILAELELELDDLVDDTLDFYSDFDTSDIKIPKLGRKFKPHLPFFEFGVASFSYDFSPPVDYLQQDYGSSITIKFNILKDKLQITKYMGFVIGLGLGWRSYELTKNIWLYKNDSLSLDEDTQLYFSKNKIKTFSLIMPLMYEVQFSKKRYPYLQFGVVGEFPFSKYYKVIYTYEGHKEKRILNLSDIVSPFLTEATIRLGFKRFVFIGSYDLLPFFKEPLPKVNPIYLGIGLTF